MKFLFLIALVAIILVIVLRGKDNSPKQTDNTNELSSNDSAPSQNTQQSQAPADPVPAQWPNWQAALEQTSQSIIAMKLIKQATTVTSSKIGGTPYWPNDKEWPVDSDGEPLIFLAQIDLAEVASAANDQVDLALPKQGLLQFFIGSDDLLGVAFFSNSNELMQSLEQTNSHRVIWHPDTSKESIGEQFMAKADAEYLPYRGEVALGFELKQQRLTPQDYRFEHFLQNNPQLDDSDDEVMEYLYESEPNPPYHQLGGYAYFTQTDPREVVANDEPWQLLFQLDTDSLGEFDIMWGDGGIANFFIRPQDLAKGDFSKVWYNWDCH